MAPLCFIPLGACDLQSCRDTLTSKWHKASEKRMSPLSAYPFVWLWALEVCSKPTLLTWSNSLV